MAKINILNLSGEQVGELDLADEVFCAEVKEHLLWEVVVAQRAARRAGTHSTKTRANVKGSTAKLFRQKGTGRARHGDIKAPIYVGGGVAHGPHPRSYAKKTPKKVRQGALRSAVSLRFGEGKLLVLEGLELGEIKTKQVAEILDRLGVKSGLIVDMASNEMLALSARNLRDSKYIAPEGLNVYDVLKHETLVVAAPAIKAIEERLMP